MTKKSVEILGLPVISITEGYELGISKTLIVDARAGAVAAITIEDEDWYRGVKLLPYSSVIAIGRDAVTVTSSKNILTLDEASDFEAMLDANIRVIGTKAITKTGTINGKVKEIFIGEDGTVEKVEIVDPQGNVSEIPADEISIFGKQVTVIGEPGDGANREKTVFVPTPKPTPPIPKPEPAPAVEVSPEPVIAVTPEPSPEPPVVEAIPEPEPEPEPDPEPVVEAVPEAAVADEPAPEPAPEPTVEVEVEVKTETETETEAESEPAPVLELELEEDPVPAKDEKPEEEKPAPKAKKATTRTKKTAAAKTKKAKEKAEEPEKEAAADKKTMDRHRRFLLGKKAGRDILAGNGAVIAKQGEEITEAMLQKAQLAGKLIELSMNAQ